MALQKRQRRTACCSPFLIKSFVLGAALICLAGCITRYPVRMPPPDCRNIAVVPPLHEDGAVSDYIYGLWLSQAQKWLGPCDQFLELEDTKPVFDMFNVGNLTPLNISDFSRRRAKKFIKETAATHIVNLNYTQKDGRIYFRAQAYQLPSLQEVKIGRVTGSWSKKLSQSELPRHKMANPYAMFAVSLIPNSVLFGASSASIENEYEGNRYHLTHQERRSYVPPLISGFGITNVEHPFGYGTIDWTFRLFPKLNVYAQNSYYEYEEILPPDSEEYPGVISYGLEMYWFAPTYNFEFTVHSPIGATFLGLGLGGGGYFYEDDFESEWGLATATSYTFGHRAFISERIFFELSYEILRSHSTVIRNRVFKGGHGQGTFLGVGYFFPSMRRYVRKTL